MDSKSNAPNSLPIIKDMAAQRAAISLIMGLAPLPKRERGTRNFLTPLLPFWEKGVGDEGNLDFAPLLSIKELLKLDRAKG